jgi:hypothetical protein
VTWDSDSKQGPLAPSLRHHECVVMSRVFRGEFWVAGRADIRHTGVLEVEPLADPVVKTAQPLLSPWQEQSRSDLPDGGTKVVQNFTEEALMTPVTVHGRDDAGTPLTLIDALTTYWGVPDGNDAAHVLQGSQAIIGVHIPDRNHLFTGIRVRLSNLRAWQPHLRDPAWASKGVLAEGGTVAFQEPEVYEASGSPSLWISGQEMSPSTLRVLDRSFWQPLVSLFTLVTGARCVPLERQVQEAPGGPWCDTYSVALHSDDKDIDTRWDQPRWLLQPLVVDARHVQVWLDKAELLGPLPAVVVDLTHARPVALDTQVLLLTTVVEGLHRRLYPGDVRFDRETAKQVQNAAVAAVNSIHERAEAAVRGLLGHVEDVGYGKRLARLAATVNTAMPGVTGRTNRWKGLVSNARNEYAHRLNTAFLEDEDFDRYLTVALSLQWLLTGVFLLQADIGEQVLKAALKSHEPYQRFLADARKWQPRIYELS